MSDYYDSNAQAFFDRTIIVDMAEIYDLFLQSVPTGGRILDAGCGVGRDVKVFVARGYQVNAFDGSAEMVKMATELSGVKVKRMKFNELSEQLVYDGVWACASLLHLNKVELPEALDRIVAALKPGGVFYASFKYGEGEHFRDQRFFNDQNEDSFRAVIESLNDRASKRRPTVQIQNLWQTDGRRPGDKQIWLNALLKKQI